MGYKENNFPQISQIGAEDISENLRDQREKINPDCLQNH
jgi:hypothetical protein